MRSNIGGEYGSDYDDEDEDSEDLGNESGRELGSENSGKDCKDREGSDDDEGDFGEKWDPGKDSDYDDEDTFDENWDPGKDSDYEEKEELDEDYEIGNDNWDPGELDEELDIEDWDPGEAEEELEIEGWDPGEADAELNIMEWAPGDADEELHITEWDSGEAEEELHIEDWDPGELDEELEPEDQDHGEEQTDIDIEEDQLNENYKAENVADVSYNSTDNANNEIQENLNKIENTELLSEEGENREYEVKQAYIIEQDPFMEQVKEIYKDLHLEEAPDVNEVNEILYGKEESPEVELDFEIREKSTSQDAHQEIEKESKEKLDKEAVVIDGKKAKLIVEPKNDPSAKISALKDFKEESQNQGKEYTAEKSNNTVLKEPKQYTESIEGSKTHQKTVQQYKQESKNNDKPAEIDGKTVETERDILDKIEKQEQEKEQSKDTQSELQDDKNVCEKPQEKAKTEEINEKNDVEKEAESHEQDTISKEQLQETNQEKIDATRDYEELSDEEKYELYHQETGKRPLYAEKETKGFKEWVEQRHTEPVLNSNDNKQEQSNKDHEETDVKNKNKLSQEKDREVIKESTQEIADVIYVYDYANKTDIIKDIWEDREEWERYLVEKIKAQKEISAEEKDNLIKTLNLYHRVDEISQNVREHNISKEEAEKELEQLEKDFSDNLYIEKEMFKNFKIYENYYKGLMKRSDKRSVEYSLSHKTNRFISSLSNRFEYMKAIKITKEGNEKEKWFQDLEKFIKDASNQDILEDVKQKALAIVNAHYKNYKLLINGSFSKDDREELKNKIQQLPPELREVFREIEEYRNEYQYFSDRGWEQSLPRLIVKMSKKITKLLRDFTSIHNKNSEKNLNIDSKKKSMKDSLKIEKKTTESTIQWYQYLKGSLKDPNNFSILTEVKKDIINLIDKFYVKRDFYQNIKLFIKKYKDRTLMPSENLELSSLIEEFNKLSHLFIMH